MLTSGGALYAGSGVNMAFRGINPVGESQNQPFQLSCNASLKVDSQGSRVTSGAGLILVRELDDRLGFSEIIVTRRLFGSMLQRIAALPSPAG